MADGRCIGQLPHEIIGDERLPLRGVRDKRLEVSLQELGGRGQRSFPPSLWMEMPTSKMHTKGPASAPRSTASQYVSSGKEFPRLFELLTRRTRWRKMPADASHSA